MEQKEIAAYAIIASLAASVFGIDREPSPGRSHIKYFLAPEKAFAAILWAGKPDEFYGDLYWASVLYPPLSQKDSAVSRDQLRSVERRLEKAGLVGSHQAHIVGLSAFVLHCYNQRSQPIDERKLKVTFCEADNINTVRLRFTYAGLPEFTVLLSSIGDFAIDLAPFSRPVSDIMGCDWNRTPANYYRRPLAAALNAGKFDRLWLSNYNRDDF